MQDYKLIIRSLTAGQTIYDAPPAQGGNLIYQNFTEFQDWLHVMYLSQGYKIDRAEFVAKGNDSASGVNWYEFAYHVSKEVPGVPEKASKPNKVTEPVGLELTQKG